MVKLLGMNEPMSSAEHICEWRRGETRSETGDSSKTTKISQGNCSQPVENFIYDIVPIYVFSYVS